MNVISIIMIMGYMKTCNKCDLGSWKYRKGQTLTRIPTNLIFLIEKKLQTYIY